MPFNRVTALALVAATITTGCDEAHPTEPPAVGAGLESAAPVDLALHIPIPSREELQTHELNEVASGAFGAGEAPAARAPYETRPLQQIFDPRTRVYFKPAYAAALGQHEYVGNVGAISTTAHVTYRNQILGSQTANRQHYIPFLYDFGTMKNIWVESKVYSDHECGLQVRGESAHRASWQFFVGSGAPGWGEAAESSQSSPASQAACPRETGTTTGSDTGPGGTTCFYLVTYDVASGDILSANLLYCASSDGDWL